MKTEIVFLLGAPKGRLTVSSHEVLLVGFGTRSGACSGRGILVVRAGIIRILGTSAVLPIMVLFECEDGLPQLRGVLLVVLRAVAREFRVIGDPDAEVERLLLQHYRSQEYLARVVTEQSPCRAPQSCTLGIITRSGVTGHCHALVLNRIECRAPDLS